MKKNLWKRFRFWWEARKISLPVEYCVINSTHPKRTTPMDELGGSYYFETTGLIPREVFEKITGTKFVRGQHNYIGVEHADEIARHPLFISNREYQARYTENIDE